MATLKPKFCLLRGCAATPTTHLNTQSKILMCNANSFANSPNRSFLASANRFKILGCSEYRYLSLLAKYPVMTKAVTSAFLTLVGDVICQLVIDQVQSLDLKRTFIFTLLGLVLVGPTLHFWYLYLSKLVTAPGAAGAFLRLLLDQFLFSPIFIGTFLSTLVTLEGKPSHVIPKLQQVLAANFIALVWNVILSYKAHKEVIAK
ncbi:hypothetical protein DH2020_019472 [Rehmannia glutinosa]|uniref:Uncharacterized protein n=1 Tax=Rehmannia glutinosa TaxID=99300 RepID=A0ABR0WR80_REHGL